MLLGTLAHNLLVWSRRWLCRTGPQQAGQLQHYGIKRMIRDLYQVSGTLSFDKQGRLRVIALQPASCLAKLLQAPLHRLLVLSRVDVILDQT
jgi:hypothetical protein